MNKYIPVCEPYFDHNELDLVTDAVRSGWVSSTGGYIQKFESEFSRYCDTNFGISTFNGTVALHLALAALGIGPGDEVIVPSMTFVASANAVAYTGATPKFVDVNPNYWCLDVDTLEKNLTPNTKALIAVHIYGHPCDMDAIMKFADRHNLFVIEDAAEAHGARVRGKRVGSFGHIGCFSFYGNKLITTGEGGMCVTSNEALASKMQILKSHGMNPDRKYWHDHIGFNYRMTNLQAAIGVAQVQKIEWLISQKRRVAQAYYERLLPVETAGYIQLPKEMEWAESSYWLYSILVSDKDLSAFDIIKKLQSYGVDSRPFFTPMHLLPPYKNDLSLPISEKLAKTGVCLPSSVVLMESEIDYIVEQLKKVVCS